MPEINPFYDREYNTTLSVPEEDSYLSAWVERSAAARAKLASHLDLAYGPGDKERLDLFPAPTSRALHIFIHGGFWRVSDKAHYSWIAPPFVEAGISVALLNYGLCPAVKLATIVEQCRRGIAWSYHHARDYGINAERIIVTGHSAGGHLTAMMFATDWSAYGMPAEAIVGGVAVSGLFDLEPLIHTSINDDIRLDKETAHALSPIHLKPQVKAPLIVAVGAQESNEFQRQSNLICENWGEICQGPLVLAGCHHFSALEQLADFNSPIWQVSSGLFGSGHK